MIKTEYITFAPEIPASNSGDSLAQVALDTCVSIDHIQTSLYQSIEQGPSLFLPTNYLNETGITVPSFDVVTLLGNRASVVDIHDSNKDLKDMFDETVKSGKGVQKRIEGMLLETVVRILDTNGAQGLHHVHGTVFPRTVYQIVKRGSGIVPNIYATQLGEREDRTPVIALLTATRDKQAEYKLFRTIGAGGKKRKRTA